MIKKSLENNDTIIIFTVSSTLSLDVSLRSSSSALFVSRGGGPCATTLRCSKVTKLLMRSLSRDRILSAVWRKVRPLNSTLWVIWPHCGSIHTSEHIFKDKTFAIKRCSFKRNKAELPLTASVPAHPNRSRRRSIWRGERRGRTERKWSEGRSRPEAAPAPSSECRRSSGQR